MTGNNRAILILLAAMALSLAIVMLFVPIIPQSQSYHAFADQRTLLGIPNFWNVISNVPFVVIGAIGWLRFRDDPATFVLFTGICLTGFGSAYYHWNPTDDTFRPPDLDDFTLTPIRRSGAIRCLGTGFRWH